jgi:hypothetical protein
MTKRNIILEIKEKNSRSSLRYLHGKLELYSLERTFSELNASDKTMMSLHIMGVTSCIEVSVREAIKRLVDSGDPYLDRAESFKEHIRFDYFLTKALSSGEITFGDLISHSLPVSRLDHIASHFEVLFADKNARNSFQKILSNVREYVEPSDEELFGDAEPGSAQRTAPFLIDDAEDLLKDIASIFEVRHLVAHEANFEAVSFDESSKFFRSARLFVEALYELVDQMLHPGVSRTSMGSSLQGAAKAGTIYQAAQAMQEGILEQISLVNSKNFDLSALFQETIRNFNSYYQAEIDFRLALHDTPLGNAMRNIESDVTARLWRHRAEYLTKVKEWVEFFVEVDKSASK